MAEPVNLWTAGAPTPRLAYVAYIIFDVVLGLPFRWCTSVSEWEQHQGVKVQYGGTPNADLGAAWIPSSGLLEGNALECPA